MSRAAGANGLCGTSRAKNKRSTKISGARTDPRCRCGDDHSFGRWHFSVSPIAAGSQQAQTTAGKTIRIFPQRHWDGDSLCHGLDARPAAWAARSAPGGDRTTRPAAWERACAWAGRSGTLRRREPRRQDRDRQRTPSCRHAGRAERAERHGWANSGLPPAPCSLTIKVALRDGKRLCGIQPSAAGSVLAPANDGWPSSVRLAGSPLRRGP